MLPSNPEYLPQDGHLAEDSVELAQHLHVLGIAKSVFPWIVITSPTSQTLKLRPRGVSGLTPHLTFRRWQGWDSNPCSHPWSFSPCRQRTWPWGSRYTGVDRTYVVTQTHTLMPRKLMWPAQYRWQLQGKTKEPSKWGGFLKKMGGEQDFQGLEGQLGPGLGLGVGALGDNCWERIQE